MAGSKNCLWSQLCHPELSQYSAAGIYLIQYRAAVGAFGAGIYQSAKRCQLKNKQLQASQIFQWFGHDFGSDEKMIKFFAHYAEDLKALYLLGFSGEIACSFDSRVNAPETIWPL